MTWLLEDPTPVIVVGVLVEAALGVALLRTGRGVLLWIMLAVAAFVGLGVLVERMVVTEREEVEATIYAAAAAVEANDLEGVLRTIAPDAKDARNLVEWGFRQVKFSRVSIQHRRLNVRVIRTTSPPSAKADIDGMVYFAQPPAGFYHNAYPLDGTLELQRHSGRWLVSGYTMRQDPRR